MKKAPGHGIVVETPGTCVGQVEEEEDPRRNQCPC
jgi:hypothetical protein